MVLVPPNALSCSFDSCSLQMVNQGEAPLRVLAMISHPFVVRSRTRSRSSGIDMDLLRGMARYLGLALEVTFLKNQTYPVLLETFQNESFDLLQPSYRTGYLAGEGIASTPAMYEDGFVFVTKSKRNRSGLIFGKLDASVWILFVAAFSLCCLAKRLWKTDISETAIFLSLGLTLSYYSNSLTIYLSTSSPPPPLFSSYEELDSLLTSKSVLRTCTLVEVDQLAGSMNEIANEALRHGLKRRPFEAEVEARVAQYKDAIYSGFHRHTANMVEASSSCLVGVTYFSIVTSITATKCKVKLIRLNRIGKIQDQYSWAIKRGNGTDALVSLMSQGSIPQLYKRFTEDYFARAIPWEKRCMPETPSYQTATLANYLDVLQLLLLGLAAAFATALLEVALSPRDSLHLDQIMRF